MAKNQTVNKAANIFLLSRFRVGCHYGTVSVDFNASQRPNNHFEQIVPLFNRDKNFTTPAFILPSQQYYYSKNIQFHQEKFEERILASDQKNSAETPLYPIPSSLYCQICKDSYHHYLDHVNSKLHLRNQRASKANIYINQLIQHLSHPAKYQNHPPKTKIISKSHKQKNKPKSKDTNNRLSRVQPQIKPIQVSHKTYNNSTNVGSELIAN